MHIPVNCDVNPSKIQEILRGKGFNENELPVLHIFGKEKAFYIPDLPKEKVNLIIEVIEKHNPKELSEKQKNEKEKKDFVDELLKKPEGQWNPNEINRALKILLGKE